MLQQEASAHQDALKLANEQTAKSGGQQSIQVSTVTSLEDDIDEGHMPAAKKNGQPRKVKAGTAAPSTPAFTSVPGTPCPASVAPPRSVRKSSVGGAGGRKLSPGASPSRQGSPDAVSIAGSRGARAVCLGDSDDDVDVPAVINGFQPGRELCAVRHSFIYVVFRFHGNSVFVVFASRRMIGTCSCCVDRVIRSFVYCIPFV